MSLSLVKKRSGWSEEERETGQGLYGKVLGCRFRGLVTNLLTCRIYKNASLEDHLSRQLFINSEIEGLANVTGKKCHCLLLRRHPGVPIRVPGIFKVDLCHVLSLGRELRE